MSYYISGTVGTYEYQVQQPIVGESVFYKLPQWREDHAPQLHGEGHIRETQSPGWLILVVQLFVVLPPSLDDHRVPS